MDVGLLLAPSGFQGTFDVGLGRPLLPRVSPLREKKLRDLGGTQHPKKYGEEWGFGEGRDG